MNNNPKYRQQWILDELKINPSISYSNVFANYSQKFAINRRTFDKDWNKANTVFSTYQEAINKAKLEECITQEKEAVKRNILSKFDSLELLTILAKTSEKDSDRIAAIKTMAEMEGWKSPTKIEQTNITPLLINDPIANESDNGTS